MGVPLLQHVLQSVHFLMEILCVAVELPVGIDAVRIECGRESPADRGKLRSQVPFFRHFERQLPQKAVIRQGLIEQETDQAVLLLAGEEIAQLF